MSEDSGRDNDRSGRGQIIVEAEDAAMAGLGRLLTFSDGVFAVAITLLIIDIKVPDLASPTSAALRNALASLAPSFVAFLISFLVIGVYWISHHRIFVHIARYDARLIRINLGLLLTIVIAPFSTSLLGHYGDIPFVVAIYAVNMVLIGGFFFGLLAYAAGPGHLLAAGVESVHLRRSLVRLAIAPVVFLLSIPLAWANPTLAELFWLSIPLVHRVISRRFRTGSASAPPPG